MGVKSYLINYLNFPFCGMPIYLLCLFSSLFLFLPPRSITSFFPFYLICRSFFLMHQILICSSQYYNYLKTVTCFTLNYDILIFFLWLGILRSFFVKSSSPQYHNFFLSHLAFQSNLGFIFIHIVKKTGNFIFLSVMN